MSIKENCPAEKGFYNKLHSVTIKTKTTNETPLSLTSMKTIYIFTTRNKAHLITIQRASKKRRKGKDNPLRNTPSQQQAERCRKPATRDNPRDPGRGRHGARVGKIELHTRGKKLTSALVSEA